MSVITSINTVTTTNSGSLSFFEGLRDINFEIKRIFYICGVKSGSKRGWHAHKTLKQFLFCPYGMIKVVCDTGTQRSEYILNTSSQGLLFDCGNWLELEWLVTDSVLCVAASDYYNEDDYIREYTEFLRWKYEH